MPHPLKTVSPVFTWQKTLNAIISKQEFADIMNKTDKSKHDKSQLF